MRKARFLICFTSSFGQVSNSSLQETSQLDVITDWFEAHGLWSCVFSPKQLLYLLSYPLLPLLLQISDMVTRYKREEITVWASTNSAIMENCQKTVARSATRGRQSSLRDNLLSPLLWELENLIVLCRTALCRTVSLWRGACCYCSSSTRACCPSCRWERAYCSSTCRVSSIGVWFGVQLWHNKPDMRLPRYYIFASNTILIFQP